MNRCAPHDNIATSGGVRRIDHLLSFAVNDTLAVVVCVDNFGVAIEEIEGRALLPAMREAVNVDKFRHFITIVHEHAKGAACVDRLELCVVADN